MSYYEETKNSKAKRTDRYRNCLILKDKTTDEILLSTRDIEMIPYKHSDIFHTVKINEIGRLDLIAYTYYKNPLLWWVIAQANDIYDPFKDMQLGMSLRIPLLETLYGYNGILL